MRHWWARWLRWALRFWGLLYQPNGRRFLLLFFADLIPALDEWLSRKEIDQKGEKKMGVVATDKILEQSVNWIVQMLLDGNCFLHLFRNDFVPTPLNWNAGDYVEASFPGYLPIPVSAVVPSGVMVQSGEWRTRSPIQVWMPPPSGSQPIYGWYITAAAVVLFAARFPAAIIMQSDSLPLALTIDLEAIARSILPC